MGGGWGLFWSHSDHIPLDHIGFVEGLDTCKKRISGDSREGGYMILDFRD